MKVVAAIDSFKGSMSSMEAGNAAKEGVLKVFPNAEVVVKPLADGGEGTTDALIEGLGAARIELTVCGPMDNEVNAYYGILQDGKTAVMEMAMAAGITLVPGRQDPLKATTRGVGEMILDAIKRGCRDFIIGIGGSATNDGGIGMLKALGYEFQDAAGEDVGEGGAALGKVSTILGHNVPAELKECNFRIACDVKNPLCGPLGATYVYGTQKGVTEEMKESLDRAMGVYADATAEFTGTEHWNVAGAGAAGGLGFAFVSYLQAELVPGVALICDAVSLQDEVKDADIVITGEGRLDAQTVMGKAPAGVADVAKAHDKKVIAFAGSVTLDAVECNKKGIDAFFPIVRGVTTLAEAMDRKNAMRNMTDTVEQVFRLL